MENLSLADQGPKGPAMRLNPPPGPSPQLPPQMFTTAAQLLDLTDKKLMVSLRDGKKLIGVLRSWDQFANLVLQSTIERVFVPPPLQPTPSNPHGLGLYADISHEIFLVRGENVLLLGEIDLDKDDDIPVGYQQSDVATVKKMVKEMEARQKRGDKRKIEMLRREGFESEAAGEVLR